MMEEHKDEKGFFGRIAAPDYHDPDNAKLSVLDSYLSNQVEGVINDNRLLEEIDSEIKRLSQEDANLRNQTKNMKKIE